MTVLSWFLASVLLAFPCTYADPYVAAGLYSTTDCTGSPMLYHIGELDQNATLKCDALKPSGTCMKGPSTPTPTNGNKTNSTATKSTTGNLLKCIDISNATTFLKDQFTEDYLELQWFQEDSCDAISTVQAVIINRCFSIDSKTSNKLVVDDKVGIQVETYNRSTVCAGPMTKKLLMGNSNLKGDCRSFGDVFGIFDTIASSDNENKPEFAKAKVVPRKPANQVKNSAATFMHLNVVLTCLSLPIISMVLLV